MEAPSSNCTFDRLQKNIKNETTQPQSPIECVNVPYNSSAVKCRFRTEMNSSSIGGQTIVDIRRTIRCEMNGINSLGFFHDRVFTGVYRSDEYVEQQLKHSCVCVCVYFNLFICRAILGFAEPISRGEFSTVKVPSKSDTECWDYRQSL